MNSFRKKILANGTRILDLTVMALALYLTLIMHTSYLPQRFFKAALSARIQLADLILVVLLAIAWNRLFAFFGLYTVRRLDDRLKEWFDIFKAVTAGTVVFAFLTLLLSPSDLDKNGFFTFWLVAITSTLSARTLVRQGLVFLRRHGRNLRYVVFVGSGPRAVDLAQKILNRRELGYRLVGFVDDQPQNTRLWQGRWLCTLDAFPDYLTRHVVDEVFIALPIKSYYEQIRRIAHFCGELGILCRVPSDWFELKTARTSAYELDGVPMLTIHSSTQQQLNHLWMKRLMDVALAGVGLLVLAPLFIIVSAMIALTSPGPVFFKQQRVGYNRRRFSMYKFRTMVSNAEAMQSALEHLNEADGPVFKISNDPRITPIGRWLRKTSIDEIPQLINVLRGEMSIVGPRPLPLRDVNGIYEHWPLRRFSMRPGLTCLWQINGRNRLHFYEWMKLDLKYVDEWSIWLDLKIILRTIPEIIKASGQ